MIGCAALAMTAATPAQADAACGGGVTYNRAGEGAWFGAVQPDERHELRERALRDGQWLRRSYARSWSHRLPTGFWDGYVTWHRWKRSYYRWQCDEYDSGTSFRFKAYRL